jgi:diguanylate cyclase (GGDEF)-like protein
MDFDRTITGPARELAHAMTSAGRLSELIRVFGEHVVAEFGVEVFDVWWFHSSPRPAKVEPWTRGEFRIPGARPLPGSELIEACTVIESELDDCAFNPPGQVLVGTLPGGGTEKGAGKPGAVHFIAVFANHGRWMVVFLRDSVLAGKTWHAQWLARNPGATRGGALPEAMVGEMRVAMLDVAIQSFAGHARRQFELEDARTELYRDDLTGLYNSRYLDLALDIEVRRATRFGTRFCVLFVDVDAFKAVNDNHGHLSGSSMLGEMGAVIKDAVREVDIVARYGGDEFVLVLLGASVETGTAIAERVRERIAAHKFRTAGGQEVQVTVSIGLAAFPENATSKEQLLRMADETMYAGKKNGKNRVEIYDARQPAAPAGTANPGGFDAING